jgi:type VI secretion system secreted protein VgrG
VTATQTVTPTPTATATADTLAVVLCPSIGATPASTPGSAGNYAVLAATTITNVPATTINGNLGLSPGSSVTGAPVVTGATDVANANSLNGQAILTNAITQAMGASSTQIPQQLGGQTLVAGAYRSLAVDNSFLLTAGILTLNAGGDPNAVWIFQMNGGSPTLTTSSSGSIVFEDGIGNPCNIFWQVGSSATIGTGTAFIGNILAGDSITLDAGATLTGRALASTAQVSLDHNTIKGCSCPGETP